jgi:transcriptional regulator with XRE-family HTH domain
MQTTINERLKILFAALGVKPAQMARVLGVSPSTLHNYTDRESKPGYEVLEKLYSSFEEINLNWLFGGAGEPLLRGAAEADGSVSNNKKFSRSMVVGHVAGNATQNQGASANEAAMQRELELMRSQLADKERTIQILLNQLSNS